MCAHVGSLVMMLCCSASGLLRSYTQPVCLLTNSGDMLTPTTVLPHRVEWIQTVNQTPRIWRRPIFHQHSSSRRRGDLFAPSCTIITLSSSSDIPSTASPQLVQFLLELQQNVSLPVKAPSNLPRVQFNGIQNESGVMCPLVCIMYIFFNQRFESSLCVVSNTLTELMLLYLTNMPSSTPVLILPFARFISSVIIHLLLLIFVLNILH